MRKPTSSSWRFREGDITGNQTPGISNLQTTATRLSDDILIGEPGVAPSSIILDIRVPNQAKADELADFVTWVKTNADPKVQLVDVQVTIFPG